MKFRYNFLSNVGPVISSEFISEYYYRKGFPALFPYLVKPCRTGRPYGRPSRRQLLLPATGVCFRTSPVALTYSGLVLRKRVLVRVPSIHR